MGTQSETVGQESDFKLVVSKRKRKHEVEQAVQDEQDIDDDNDDEYEDIEIDEDLHEENTQSPDKKPKFPALTGEKSKVCANDSC